MHTAKDLLPWKLTLLQIYSLNSKFFPSGTDLEGVGGKKRGLGISPAHPGSSHPTKEGRDNGRRGDKHKSPRSRTGNAVQSKALEPAQRFRSSRRHIITASGPASGGLAPQSASLHLQKQKLQCVMTQDGTQRACTHHLPTAGILHQNSLKQPTPLLEQSEIPLSYHVRVFLKQILILSTWVDTHNPMKDGGWLGNVRYIQLLTPAT